MSSCLVKHLSTRAERPEQAAGAAALTEQAPGCPRFQGKGGNKNLGNKALYQVGGRRGNVLASPGRAAADPKARRSRARVGGSGAPRGCPQPPAQEQAPPARSLVCRCSCVPTGVHLQTREAGATLG